MFQRSRRNLARWFTGSMGSILIIFAGLLYLREVHDRLHTFDLSLYNTSQIMAGGVEEIEYDGQHQIELENVPLLGNDSHLLDTEVIFIRWYTADKRLLQFFGPIPPEFLTEATGFVTRVDETGDRLRQLTLPVYQDTRLIGYLQLAASLSPVEAPLQKLRLFLAIGVPLSLGVIALTGWVLGGAAMQPIHQSYQRLQQFTADASHELRAPLAGIISNAQVGLMPPVDLQEQTTRLQVISDVAESMSGLVSQLLFLARHEGALPPDVLQRVDGMALLKGIVEDFQPQLTEKSLTLNHQFPSHPVWLSAEPDLLRQAIANLLSNACRYTPAGGTIQVSLHAFPRWIVIRVSDTGVGIPDAEQDKIFERFYRVDTVRSRQTGGFGLGLAIVRQIVNAHKGQISVTSQPNQGSTFEIRLPSGIKP